MIVVVAKKPDPGLVKTRLSPPLTPSQAADVALDFLDRTFASAFTANVGEVAIGFAPSDSRPWFQERFPHCRLFEQGDGDLGARMETLANLVFQAGARKVILIGADTPHMPPERLAEASRRLDAADVVIGPAEDGGYYLIGLRRPAPELFRNIHWSGPYVLQETLQRVQDAGLSFALLEPERDIDTAEDLEWLRTQRGYELPVSCATNRG